MQFILQTLLLSFTFTSLGATQQIRVFSDDNCNNPVGPVYTCDGHHTCQNIPGEKTIGSIKIVKKGLNCPDVGGEQGVYNSWFLTPPRQGNEGTACAGKNSVGYGCKPEGCQKTFKNKNGKRKAGTFQCRATGSP